MAGQQIKINDVAKELKIKKDVLEYHINKGNIESDGKNIPYETYLKIKDEQKKYISIDNYMRYQSGVRYDGTRAKDRNHYYDFLEENEYFGVELFPYNGFLFAVPDDKTYYITSSDAEYLDFKSIGFLEMYGFSYPERIELYKNKDSANKYNVELINSYFESHPDLNRCTPAVASFVECVCDSESVTQLTNEDVALLLNNIDTTTSRDILREFLNFVAKNKKVNYGSIETKKKEHLPAKAYSYETLLKFALLLFNEENEINNELVRKSLNNHFFAETWMFLSIHFICGWRAKSICDLWVYPCVSREHNPFNIDIDSLKEDILDNKIPDSLYEKITDYIVLKTKLERNVPPKTGENADGELQLMIPDELKVFFGRLTLIAEYHHLTTGEGYMLHNRISRYENRIYAEEFLGKDFKLVFSNNISSRRLNKCYEQGMEVTARGNGNSPLVAHMIAAMARNHSNLDTTAIYLQDHELTGENAELVFYLMSQRGVMSTYLYQLLMKAYPDAFAQLTMEEQTKLLKEIPLTALELEVTAGPVMAGELLKDAFEKNEEDYSKSILKAMYEIGNGHGKSKDEGIYCLKTALGYACPYPTHNCLANVCPFHVFTKNGIGTLVSVVNYYIDKYNTTKNRKYLSVLKYKIHPAFKGILDSVFEEMSKDEKHYINKYIEDTIHE